MKKTVLLCLLALAGAFASCDHQSQTDATLMDYTKYVNPFIGAADNGHTFPGATTPFGMIQTSPVTGAVGWRYCSEYMNADSIIWGFTASTITSEACTKAGMLFMGTSPTSSASASVFATERLYPRILPWAKAPARVAIHRAR